MRQTLGIIGVGAFGEWMIKHLTPYFSVRVFDAKRDLAPVADMYAVENTSLEQVAQSDIVVLCVPVRVMANVMQTIVPYLKAGQLLIDVGSVKTLPQQVIEPLLPAGVDYVGLHPLFGPQSGKHGIEGLNIALVNCVGARGDCVGDFLANRLKLNVHYCTAAEHDRQMAYVQGLTHMVAKVFVRMGVPELALQTKTFALLQQMVDCIKDDSDELFRTIQKDNPFVETTKGSFFEAVKKLEQDLG